MSVGYVCAFECMYVTVHVHAMVTDCGVCWCSDWDNTGNFEKLLEASTCVNPNFVQSLK